MRDCVDLFEWRRGMGCLRVSMICCHSWNRCSSDKIDGFWSKTGWNIWDSSFLHLWRKQSWVEVNCCRSSWKVLTHTRFIYMCMCGSVMLLLTCAGETQMSSAVQLLPHIWQIQAHTHTHTFRLEWTNTAQISAAFLLRNTKIQNCLLAGAVCRFHRRCLSVSFFLPVCLSRWRTEVIPPLLPPPPPLLSPFLSLQQQHRKMGHEQRKKWQRKTETRSNLILIWFLSRQLF